MYRQHFFGTLQDVRGSNSDAMYPPEIDLKDATSWPEWKDKLSDPTVLYDLGFCRVDEYTYKRIDANGLALYVSTPTTARDVISLWGTYITGKLQSSHADIRSERKRTPILATMLLNRRTNSDIVCSMP